MSRGGGARDGSAAGEAQKAVSQLNGVELAGRTLNVSEAKERTGGSQRRF